MKAITNHLYLYTPKEKDLFIKLVLLSTITIGVCSNTKSKSSYQAVPIELKDDVHVDPFGDFDQAHVPNKPPVINKMISVLKPQFSVAKRKELAVNIHQALSKYKIPPQIALAIIDTESDFNQAAVSSTGDLSLAQINAEVWNKEFERLKMSPIDSERLKIDQVYSLEVMAKILHILKKRHAKHDRRWYARYHSGTKKHKEVYLTKLASRMKLLENAQVVALQ